jgi:hypothetical protein
MINQTYLLYLQQKGTFKKETAFFKNHKKARTLLPAKAGVWSWLIHYHQSPAA